MVAIAYNLLWLGWSSSFSYDTAIGYTNYTNIGYKYRLRATPRPNNIGSWEGSVIDYYCILRKPTPVDGTLSPCGL